MVYFILLSLLAGMAVVTQANINAYVGTLLSSSVVATLIALILSTSVVFIASLLYVKQLPSFETIKIIPLYLWLSIGLLGAFALGTFYYVIPKIGILSMISYSLCGQLIISMVFSHFGWLNMPVSTITLSKILGIISMMIGIFLINK